MEGGTSVTKSHAIKTILVAAAVASGIALSATPSTATPIATGLIGSNSAAPTPSPLVEKVYYKRHRHHAYYRYYRHRRHHYYYSYYPHYYGFSSYYCVGYYGGYYGDCGGYGYGYPFVPFIGFSIGGHHHHHH
jgi:hypothetical protein